jgi:porin-like protein
MRNILFAIIVAVLPAAAVAAGLSDLPKPGESTVPVDRPLPVKRAGTVKTCAAYGPGFVKVEGSDTCVKLGGGIRVDAAGSR